jgi:hypothetical protein
MPNILPFLRRQYAGRNFPRLPTPNSRRILLDFFQGATYRGRECTKVLYPHLHSIVSFTTVTSFVREWRDQMPGLYYDRSSCCAEEKRSAIAVVRILDGKANSFFFAISL